eukprot:9117289-Pyramimonas_sp.AAC.1
MARGALACATRTLQTCASRTLPMRHGRQTGPDRLDLQGLQQTALLEVPQRPPGTEAAPVVL